MYELIKNLDSFILGYTYNLSDEVFIEITESDSVKTNLNTVKLIHFVNSIQIHGLGLLNFMVIF